MLQILLVAITPVSLLFMCIQLGPAQVTRLLMRLGVRAVGMKRREIVVDNLRIACLDGGNGEPLMLLHGLGADKSNFLT